ncbi:MAG: Rrf2 family transcriptional regulator [Ruminococcus sp.]|jgi:Rrf2 family protein|nr:Rrf2 family transcriptional regulator [Ruminococcus sp.]
MKISAKGRYSLAALVQVAKVTESGQLATVAEISSGLGISKIFLEQAFSELKKAKILTSVKGAKGGYSLNPNISKLTVYDILQAVDNSLFLPTEKTVENIPTEATLEMVWNKLDKSVGDVLGGITLADLVDYEEEQNFNFSYMINM